MKYLKTFEQFVNEGKTWYDDEGESYRIKGKYLVVMYEFDDFEKDSQDLFEDVEDSVDNQEGEYYERIVKHAEKHASGKTLDWDKVKVTTPGLYDGIIVEIPMK